MAWAFFPVTIAPHIGAAPTWAETGTLPEAKLNVTWGSGYQLSFLGNPIPVVYLSEGSVPPGWLLSPSGFISPGPFAAVGVYYPILAIYNGIGEPVEKTFTLNVSESVTNPTITSGAASTALFGDDTVEQLAASGTAPIVWSVIAGALPTGRSLSVSGLISGSHTATGVFNYTVQASNNALGGTTPATQARTTTVNRPPVISTNSLSPIVAGEQWTGTIAFVGYPAPSLTATYNGGALPGTLAVNSSTGALSGTYNVQGTYDILFSATNAYGTATRTLSLTIQASAGTVNPCPGSYFSWNNNGLTTPTNKVDGTIITAIHDIAGGVLNFNRTSAPGTQGPSWDNTEAALCFRGSPFSALRASVLNLGSFPCWSAFLLKMLGSNALGVLGFMRATNVYWHYDHSSGASDRFGISAGALAWSGIGQFDDGYVNLITEFVDATHANIRINSATYNVAIAAVDTTQLDFILNQVGISYNLKAIALGQGALNTIGA